MPYPISMFLLLSEWDRTPASTLPETEFRNMPCVTHLLATRISDDMVIVVAIANHGHAASLYITTAQAQASGNFLARLSHTHLFMQLD